MPEVTRRSGQNLRPTIIYMIEADAFGWSAEPCRGLPGGVARLRECSGVRGRAVPGLHPARDRSPGAPAMADARRGGPVRGGRVRHRLAMARRLGERKRCAGRRAGRRDVTVSRRRIGPV